MMGFIFIIGFLAGIAVTMGMYVIITNHHIEKLKNRAGRG